MSTAEFERDGFIFLKNVFAPNLLDDFENAIIELAKKLIVQNGGVIPEVKTPYQLLQFVEQNYKVSFFHLCAHVGCSVAGLRLVAAENIVRKVSELAGVPSTQLFPFHPAVFYNDRNVERLQTSFHQEQSYFPFAKNVYHLWFPLFRNLTPDDGPMIVCRGSHKEHYPYTVHARPQSITRLETSPEIVSRFEQVPCAINRGDVVLFHNNTIHATGENLTDTPRISGVIRYMNLMTVEETFEPYIKFVYSEKNTKDDISAKAQKVASAYEN